MTTATASPVPAPSATRRSEALHAEYKRHLGECDVCAVPRWCAAEAELDYLCDVAVRREYGN